MITIIIPEWMAWAIAIAVLINCVLTVWSIIIRTKAIAAIKKNRPF